MKKRVFLTIMAAGIAALILQGCGGSAKHSVVSGTVSDINRNVVIDASVWVDGDEIHTAQSLVSGAYKLEGIESGWRTIRASAIIKNEETGSDELWVGSTAAEVLKDEPTMNINVTLAREGKKTQVGGVVEDDTNDPVAGARVFLTTRLVYPYEDTSAYDGPYGSIVAITDEDGHYLMEDVPVGLSGIIAASKVGFRNEEVDIETISEGLVQNFSLEEALNQTPDVPFFEAIESYTMPDSIVRSDSRDAYKTIKAFTSERYRKAGAARKTALTRATPAGSLIEIDLYWNALDVNDSRDIAGYGIYRTLSPSIAPRAIDFVRDPYANFYSDMGIELTPGTNYFYAISAVSMSFLLPGDVINPEAEGDVSDFLSTSPLAQLRALTPDQNGSETSRPVFRWSAVSGADFYAVYLYDRFPSYPLDPGADYTGDPAQDIGLLPVWPTQSDPGGSTTSGTNIQYPGSGVPTLQVGHTYYWVALGGTIFEEYNDGTPKRSAYSYSEIRSFTVR